MALVVLASASSIEANAQKKSKKNAKQTATVEKKEPLKLVTSRDSVSYASGMQFNDGLDEFLKQEYKVDTAYMDDFKKGFNEALSKDDKDQKFNAYIAGTQIAKMVKTRMLPRMESTFKDTNDSINTDLFYQGFMDAIDGNTSLMNVKSAESYVKEKSTQVEKAKLEKQFGDNRRAGEAFLADNANKEGVTVLPSGLQYKVITMGSGDKPGNADKVKVKYEGRLIDGKVFDSSYKHGGDSTIVFGVNQVIKGWTEALKLMPAGSKWQLYIPYQLAYGERQAGKDIKPFSALVFDVDLVEVNPTSKKETDSSNGKNSAATKKTKQPAKKNVRKKR